MNAKRVNTAAEVILAALTQNRTAAGIALALEAAGMLTVQPTPNDVNVLAKARTQAWQELRRDTGTSRPGWRTVITDSESPTGFAPVCSGERSDALHMIEDYPGGPQRDEDGVYDCCPYPQIDMYSGVWAEYLVGLLNADASDELTGAYLARWEEEQDNARLRLALKSAQRGRREARAQIAELKDAQGTAFRASHDSIVMGLYTTAAAAREHCETLIHREQPDADLNWYPDTTEGDDEDTPEGLFMVVAGEESDTGYVVTPLTVASEYDAEADE